MQVCKEKGWTARNWSRKNVLVYKRPPHPPPSPPPLPASPVAKSKHALRLRAPLHHSITNERRQKAGAEQQKICLNRASSVRVLIGRWGFWPCGHAAVTWVQNWTNSAKVPVRGVRSVAECRLLPSHHTLEKFPPRSSHNRRLAENNRKWFWSPEMSSSTAVETKNENRRKHEEFSH